MKSFAGRMSPVSRDCGNLLIFSLFVMFVILALSLSLGMIVQKNLIQSNFFAERNELSACAESGVNIALHDLSFGGTGDVGTEGWSLDQDVGFDGAAGSRDEGESDGIPTPGESGLTKIQIGAIGRILVKTTDSDWPGVKKVVSAAYGPNTYAAIEVYAAKQNFKIPRVGAVYTQPGVMVDLSGGALSITGKDTNPGGTAGSEPPVYGIVTNVGDPPGSNMDEIKLQIPNDQSSQVQGIGGKPSVGETAEVDFNALFKAFMGTRKVTVLPGGYSSTYWGNYQANQFQVTYCPGDLKLSGNGGGAGVLLVEGSLTLSGSFNFNGLVMVKGDVRLTGGGNAVQVNGMLMIGQAFSNDTVATARKMGMTGNTKICYSSTALNWAAGLFGNGFQVLYWNHVR